MTAYHQRLQAGYYTAGKKKPKAEPVKTEAAAKPDNTNADDNPKA